MAKKNCEHPRLRLVHTNRIDGLLCDNCGKTWNWNPLLQYYSDSYLGTFIKEKSEVSANSSQQ